MVLVFELQNISTIGTSQQVGFLNGLVQCLLLALISYYLPIYIKVITLVLQMVSYISPNKLKKNAAADRGHYKDSGVARCYHSADQR